MSQANTPISSASNPEEGSASTQREQADFSQWFTKEVQPHEPLLRAFLRRWVVSFADVDDLVQECYIRIFRARKSSSIRSGKAFLFTVARNAVYDLNRRRAVSSSIAITETAALPVLDDSPGVVDLISYRQNLALLAEAIQELPKRCREVFLLRKIQELSQKEIAARLGITENTVEKLVAKGALRCADYLRKHGDAPRSHHAP